MITAYVKPTNFCNVGCTHCYLPEEVRANKFLMTEDRVREVARFVKDMAMVQRHDSAHILWHGGEPLTVPIDWYYKANDILKEELGYNYIQSMQTSLIPLRKEHIKMFKDFMEYQVGTSIDFSQRMLKGKVENYHKLWMTKVDMAREEDILVLPGVVPTRNELGREKDIVQFFMDRNFKMFNIDRYNQYNTFFPDRPSNLEHSKFLIGLFDALMENLELKGWSPFVNAISGAMTGILYDQGGDRWGTTCMTDFVVIEPNGNLNNCTDKATVEPSYSQLEDGYKEFARSHFRKKWVKIQTIDHKENHCRKCENASWCRSGCPITPNGIINGEDECSGYKTFINHVREFIKKNGEEPILKYLEQREKDPWVDLGSPYSAAKYEVA